MDKTYWDDIADTFDRHVLEIARHDPEAHLRREISRVGSASRSAADLGCGPGSLIPLLAESFGQVFAVDHSSHLLDAARGAHQKSNVQFLQHDLSSGDRLPFQADFVLCSNTLISPSRPVREGIMTAVASSTKSGGKTMLVVPALESVFHVYHSLIRCRGREGKGSGLKEGQADRLLRSEMDSFAGGVIRVSGVPTKYWMREELLAELGDHGFEPEQVHRIEYGWEEEIDNPPCWLGSPRPWDWMVVARRP